MPLPLEERWGLFTLFEYEYSARQTLQKLREQRQLRYISDLRASSVTTRRRFVEESSVRFLCQSLSQGKELFRHAETADWRVKPLLLYYAMLSMVKAALVFKFPDYFQVSDHLRHGVTIGPPARRPFAFRDDYVELKGAGVYQLARRALDFPRLPADLRLTLHDILTRLPDLDSWYRILLHLPDTESNCLRFLQGPDLALRQDENTHEYFVSLHLTADQYDSFRGKFPRRFSREFPSSFRVIEGQRVREFASRTRNRNRAEVAAAGDRLIAYDANNNLYVIATLTGQGRRHTFVEIELHYLLMFYLSNLARYQPHIWSQIYSGRNDQSAIVIQGFIRTCENKFLQLLQRYLQAVGLISLS